MKLTNAYGVEINLDCVAAGETGTPSYSPARNNLRDCQRQLDADGFEVGVSRQALDEVLSEHTTLLLALRYLTMMARTSGGTAGPDAGLMAACEQAETAIQSATGAA